MQLPEWATKRYGPLPAWAWAGGIAAGIGLFIWKARSGSSLPSQAPLADYGTPAGSGGSGGSGSGAAPGVSASDLAALAEVQQQQFQSLAGALTANQAQMQSDLTGLLHDLAGNYTPQYVAAPTGVSTSRNQTATPAGVTSGAINTDPTIGNAAGMYQGPVSNISDQRNGGGEREGTTAHTADLSQSGVVVVDNPSFGSPQEREALYQHNIAASGGGN